MPSEHICVRLGFLQRMLCLMARYSESDITAHCEYLSISCPFLTLSLLSAWVYLYYNRSRTLFVYGINSWFVFSVQNKIIYTCLAGITCSFTSFAFGVDRSMYHPLHLYFLVSSPRNAQVPAGAGRNIALFESSFPFSLALQICITYVRQFSHL